jgi:glycosyltransferase involved in cell wall biosynthesis
MPGQYKHLARAFGAEGGHRIFFITKHKTAEMPGVTRVPYVLEKSPAPETHRYLQASARAVMQGQQVWRIAKALQEKEGFTPQVIVAHPGWGDALFIKDLFPHAKLLNFCEFYYRAQGADVGFEDPITDDDRARVRMKNVTNQLSLEAMDWGIAPTVWQWSVQPPEYRAKISVLHDGVDTKICAPDAQASMTLGNGKTFRPGDEVMTYVARNFEPYRGFPTFMQAAEIILRKRPNCHIIAIGADEVSYGKKAAEGTTYRQEWLKKVKLPRERMHFVGNVPYDQLIRWFQVSAAHLYLTYPFVLSWSMLEAMSTGVALVASRTKPVLEVVEDGVNGLLADFNSPQDVAAKIIRLLEDKTRNAAMRAQARATVMERFNLDTILPLQMQLVRDLAAGKVPPPVDAQIKKYSPVERHAKAMWSGN